MWDIIRFGRLRLVYKIPTVHSYVQEIERCQFCTLLTIASKWPLRRFLYFVNKQIQPLRLAGSIIGGIMAAIVTAGISWQRQRQYHSIDRGGIMAATAAASWQRQQQHHCCDSGSITAATTLSKKGRTYTMQDASSLASPFFVSHGMRWNVH